MQRAGNLCSLFVFDRKKSLRTVLGPRPQSHLQGTRVLPYKNVVVFYTFSEHAPDRTEEILRSLRQVL